MDPAVHQALVASRLWGRGSLSARGHHVPRRRGHNPMGMGTMGNLHSRRRWVQSNHHVPRVVAQAREGRAAPLCGRTAVPEASPVLLPQPHAGPGAGARLGCWDGKGVTHAGCCPPHGPPGSHLGRARARNPSQGQWRANLVVLQSLLQKCGTPNIRFIQVDVTA